MEMGWLVVPPRGSQRRVPLDVIVRGRVVERWEAVVLARERQSWDGDLASVVNNSGFRRRSESTILARTRKLPLSSSSTANMCWLPTARFAHWWFQKELVVRLYCAARQSSSPPSPENEAGLWPVASAVGAKRGRKPR